ncbi:intradiol ring-cleavage dioxygenase [Achromobacter aegrifaciens]|uniref:intradiol ring-cleavage dioxygenase n=1 Tax=Achromobacter aegrifaciens TaxID=1287736 RepID=UPI000F737EC0|nr:intradiol ring-cleavage dioxygenase [Achromobacter aegrifaciens]RSF09414.1 6-chlorohydroxyquinol-1,2-dioxygenase [Achromobacter aegrifaciens]
MNPAMPNAETALTDTVAAACAQPPDPRLRQLMQSLVRHLHAFVADVEPTEAEWMAAIRFLTETGQICDGAVRQEFILLSDTLGVSMLVDAINHRKPGQATESTVFGPFYMAGMPERAAGEDMAQTPGEPALVHGHVRDTEGRPLAGAVLEVWQTAANGMYSGQDLDQPQGNLRGRYRSGEDGSFAIRTILPVSYPIPGDGPVGRMMAATGRHIFRPAHLHFMIDAPGHQRLVTHLFNAGDPYLASDAVFGVKPSLVLQYRPQAADSALGKRYGFGSDFHEGRYDFVLPRA